MAQLCRIDTYVQKSLLVSCVPFSDGDSHSRFNRTAVHHDITEAWCTAPHRAVTFPRQRKPHRTVP